MDVDTLVPAAMGKFLKGYGLIYHCRDALGLVMDNVSWPVPQFFSHLDRTFTPTADGMVLTQGDLRASAAFFGRRTTRKVPTVQVLNVPPVRPPGGYRVPTARPVRINYSGYVSPVRGARILVEAFRDRADVAVDIVGDIRYAALQRQFQEMRNATLHGRVPYQRALELMDQADLIWLHYDNSLKNVAIASANKMFEAMMLGKPYLTADGCWMAEVAREFGLGWSLPYGDMDGLVRLVHRLNADPSLLVEAGRRGREAFERYFTWEGQRENIVRLYRAVLEDAEIPQRDYEGWARFIGR
jgi:glycosyltransferase involved in cell wall biosynthesis